MVSEPIDHATAIKPSNPQAIPAISIAGWPFKRAGQRVQPSQTGTAIMARPSTNQMSASTVRLSAPGCHIAPSVWRVSVLIRDIGDRRIERAHKIIDGDECTITVPAGAKCGSTPEQLPINDHRPARFTADRRNGPSFVTRRFESLSRIRKFILLTPSSDLSLGQAICVSPGMTTNR